ncbi:alpha/beta hydrolase [Streptomyces sp. NPDC047072]|uniref:alpha/beta hydrolase n=1 Tax=Streptomyces sp. NPDC047072 TaxID=3154809 RepID=UPI0033E9C88D
MTLVPPPFDPELGAALAIVSERLPRVFTLDVVAAMRQGEAAMAPTDEQLSQEGFFEVEERAVPGPEGDPEIALLICRPAAPRALGPRPVLYYAHGGGMVIGTSRTGVDLVLDWARELDAVVVSVEYRRAPEHPHPPVARRRKCRRRRRSRCRRTVTAL